MALLQGFNDIPLYFQDTGGDGRPVVLIHGWPLSGASWRDQAGPLEGEGYRVVTYDRRGFGRSDKPLTGYGYDTLADDLGRLLAARDLREVTLVGFSMGGGEVARYVAKHGQDRLRSVVFASSVTPYLMQTSANPDGPLTKAEARKMSLALTRNKDRFYDDFITTFYSADGTTTVSAAQVQQTVALCQQASKVAALEAMASFGRTDFRQELAKVRLPALVLHGDSDAIVPFEGSGQRTHEALADSELVVIPGGPHGVNVSHSEQFNQALLEFLAR